MSPLGDVSIQRFETNQNNASLLLQEYDVKVKVSRVINAYRHGKCDLLPSQVNESNTFWRIDCSSIMDFGDTSTSP